MKVVAELGFPERRLLGMLGMGMDPGKHDLIQAEFEAKLLAKRQVPDDDPAEDHMNRVKRLVFWWTAALLVIAGGVLWFAGDIAAVAGTACLTAVVLAVTVTFYRKRARLSLS
jgi:hypothetical protein